MTTLFERLTNELVFPQFVDQTYPRYNQIRTPEETIIEVSVPGRSKEDLEVTLDNQRLIVSCAKLPEKDNAHYVHKGLTGKGFQIAFGVSQATEVKEVKLLNGLLTIRVGNARAIPQKLEVL